MEKKKERNINKNELKATVVCFMKEKKLKKIKKRICSNNINYTLNSD